MGSLAAPESPDSRSDERVSRLVTIALRRRGERHPEALGHGLGSLGQQPEATDHLVDSRIGAIGSRPGN